MTRKQTLAIVAPLILIPVMYAVFQLAARAFGHELAWYLGLSVYWLTWCAAFSIWMIGKETIWQLIQPQKLTLQMLLIVIFPLAMTLGVRFVVGMEYQTASIWALVGLIFSAFANGSLEEILWRGVYMKVFPDNNLWRIVWPSLWFAAWHYTPGSISANNQLLTLIIGSGLLGFYSSLVAKKTETLWWSIIIHTLGGLILVVS